MLPSAVDAVETETKTEAAAAGPVAAATGVPISPAYARYMLAVLAMVALVHNVDRQIVSILLVPIQNDLRVSDTAMGFLTGFAFSAVYITAGIPMAYLCDRANRVRILSAAVVIWSASTALCGAAANYAQLALTRIGVALGESVSNPAAVSFISDLFPLTRRATATGVYYVGAASGTFVGMWLGGWINDAMGWRSAFVIVGVPGILVGLLVLMTVAEPKRGSTDRWKARSTDDPSFFQVLSYLWQLRTFRFVILANAFHAIAMYAAFAWTPTFVLRVHKIAMVDAGFWIGITIGIGLPSAPCWVGTSQTG